MRFQQSAATHSGMWETETLTIMLWGRNEHLYICTVSLCVESVLPLKSEVLITMISFGNQIRKVTPEVQTPLPKETFLVMHTLPT